MEDYTSLAGEEHNRGGRRGLLVRDVVKSAVALQMLDTFFRCMVYIDTRLEWYPLPLRFI
jgi:hypothetical protein